MEVKLSKWFREMYDIPESVPVFDKARLFTEDEYYQTGNVGCGDWYWVHVTNAPPAWEETLRVDMMERGEPITLPEGFNNVVEVVDASFSRDRMLVYMHYRPWGLPTNF